MMHQTVVDVLTFIIIFPFSGGRFRKCLPLPHLAVSIKQAAVKADMIWVISSAIVAQGTVPQVVLRLHTIENTIKKSSGPIRPNIWIREKNRRQTQTKPSAVKVATSTMTLCVTSSLAI